MYTSQILNERINTMLGLKDRTQKSILSAVKANVNSLNQMSDKKGLSSFTLAKIADELDCSVDYLLGRTDNPNSITNGNISHSSVAQASGSNNRISIQSKSEYPYSEVIEHLDNLSPAERRHAIADLMDVLENQYPIKKK